MNDDIRSRIVSLCFLQALFYYWSEDYQTAEHCLMQSLTWAHPVGLLLSQILQ
jgi:hypothetical protein